MCIKDVQGCDIYVGIFAWRYGSTVSWGDPPKSVAITELEYRHAPSENRLIFLLREETPWSTTFMDAITGENEKGACIAALREELGKNHTVRLFFPRRKNSCSK